MYVMPLECIFLFWQLLPQANEANIVNNIVTPEMIPYFILSFSYKKWHT